MSNDFLFPVAAGPSTRFGVHGAVSGVVLLATSEKTVLSGALTPVDALTLALMMVYELREQCWLETTRETPAGAAKRARGLEEALTEAMKLMHAVRQQLSIEFEYVPAKSPAADGESQA